MGKFPVPRLYHATRMENMPSILSRGLLTQHYGKVHGEMDYAPAGPSVYLSRHETSSNLNANLFARNEDGSPAQVVLLEIDPEQLDPDLVYPDDSMLYAMDEMCLENWEDDDEEERSRICAAYAERYGIGEEQARRLIIACDEEGEDRYPHILKEIWREFLLVEGEIAYMGNIPPCAILAVREHDMVENSLLVRSDEELSIP